MLLLIYMGTFRQMAGVAADPVVELGLVRNPSPMVHAILALVLLVIATVLGVYKPFGTTPYGRRKHVERRPAVGASAFSGSVPSITSTGTVPWPYIAAVIAILVLVFVLLHFAGGHVRH